MPYCFPEIIWIVLEPTDVPKIGLDIAVILSIM